MSKIFLRLCVLAVSGCIFPAAFSREPQLAPDDRIDKAQWTGAAGDGRFSTPGNWLAGTTPKADAVLVFDAATMACAPAFQKLRNDLHLAFSGIRWGDSDRKTADCVRANERIQRRVEIDALTLRDQAEARQVVSNGKDRFVSRVAVDRLTLEGDFVLRGGPLFTPNDGDSAPFVVPGKVNFEGGASAYRTRNDRTRWVHALYRPANVIAVNSDGAIDAPPSKVQLTPEIIQDLWAVFCFSCDLIVTENLFPANDFEFHLSTLPGASPARLVHDMRYSEQPQVIVRAWFHSSDDVFGYVNSPKQGGGMLLEGWRYWGVPPIQRQAGSVGEFRDETVRVH